MACLKCSVKSCAAVQVLLSLRCDEAISQGPQDTCLANDLAIP